MRTDVAVAPFEDDERGLIGFDYPCCGALEADVII